MIYFYDDYYRWEMRWGGGGKDIKFCDEPIFRFINYCIRLWKDMKSG